MEENKEQELKQKRTIPIVGIISGVIALAAVIVVIILLSTGGGKGRKVQEQLDLGNKYLSELDYGNAIIAYRAAIEIDPKCEEAYLSLANVYIVTSRYEEAAAVLAEAEGNGVASSEIEALENEVEYRIAEAEETATEPMSEEATTAPESTSEEETTTAPEATSEEPTQSVVTGTTENGMGYRIENGEVTITGITFTEMIEVVIPETVEGYPVTGVASGAFSGCENLETIINNSSYDLNLSNAGLTGTWNQQGTDTATETITNGQTAVRIFAVTASGVTGNGMKYEIYENGKAAVTGTTLESITEAVIPETIEGYPVTSIGDYAFSHCGGLTSIEIPSGVTNIGDGAFSYCSGLTSIEIPSGVTNIGDGAFFDCSGLTSIKIPDSVTNIGDYAFFDCSGLTSIEIPSGVTSIGNSAFSDCSGLTSIKIPDSVTSIGNNAFWGCSGLTSVTIPDSVTNIGDGAFNDCSSLTSVIIPDRVTSIGNSVFSWCRGLTNLKVADRNTVYDSRDNCNAIIETSGNTLIAGCNETIIPFSVTSIGDEAFIGRSGLTSVTIPDSVTSIGDYTFWDCSGLTTVTIPSSVTRIGVDAFTYCSGLTTVTNHSACVLSLSYLGDSSKKWYLDGTNTEVNEISNGQTAVKR